MKVNLTWLVKLAYVAVGLGCFSTAVWLVGGALALHTFAALVLAVFGGVLFISGIIGD